MAKCICRRRQWAREDLQQERLPAPGTPSKATRWGQREKKTWKPGEGMETRECLCYKAYGLCEEADVSVWRGEGGTHTSCCICYCNPPMGWANRCVERLHWHAGTLRAHLTFSLMIFSLLLFQLSPSSSPLHLLITPLFHKSSRVAYTLASHLFSAFWLITNFSYFFLVGNVCQPFKKSNDNKLIDIVCFYMSLMFLSVTERSTSLNYSVIPDWITAVYSTEWESLLM